MAGQTETLTVKLNLDTSGFSSKMNEATASMSKMPSSANSATASIKNTAAGMLLAKGATAGFSYRDWETDRKSTRMNSSHRSLSRMTSSA